MLASGHLAWVQLRSSALGHNLPLNLKVALRLVMYQHIGLVAGYRDATDWTEVLLAPCFLRSTLVMVQSYVMFVLHFIIA